MVSTASGDTVRYRRLNRNQLNGGDYFLDAVLEPDYSLTVLCTHLTPNANPALSSDRFYSLLQLDTLGNVRWQQLYPYYPVGTIVSANALLRVPDGYLVLADGVSSASTSTVTYTQGGVVKFDRLGNPLWQRAWPSRGYGGVGSLGGLVAQPDGSYLATGLVDNGTPYAGGAATPRFDHWLVQFTPRGDTIRTSRFGASGIYESGRTVASTAGGGALVSGVRFVSTSTGGYLQPQLVQVDSLLRPQWTHDPPRPNAFDDNFALAQPLRGGGAVVGGNVYNRGQNVSYAYLTALTAAGAVRWTMPHNFGGGTRPTGFTSGVLRADSSAYLNGGTNPTITNTTYERAFFRFANVGVPFVADLCRVPPQASVGYGFTAGGDSLRLVSLSTAGPRYAALALWRWDFGDGTFFDGPAPPPHRYAAAPGAGTRVTLTVTNNLGCASTQSVFPFALATAAARALAAGARLWPNPTAGAVVLEVPGLRAQSPVALEVVNALGQVVLARAAVVRQGQLREVLDLSGWPPGVYAVRLRAQEGTVVKRLVRE